MTLFIVAVVSGITLGGTFALVGLGLVLAYRATGTFNFAHGEFMLLPAFMVGYLLTRGMNIAPALAISLTTSAIVGALFYILVLRHTTGQPFMRGIIATFGLALVLDGLMGIFFSSSSYTIRLPGIPDGSVKIFGARVASNSLTFAGITLILSLLVVGVLRFTNVGVRVRASGRDPILASQCGIPVRMLHTTSWVIAAVLAAVAGICYASVTVASTDMLALGLAAIPAIMFGGLDSIEGAIIGGLLLGIVQSFSAAYLGERYVNLITYGVLLVVLLLRPQGLLGTKSVVRA